MDELAAFIARLNALPWRDAFDSSTLERGAAYAREGRPRLVEFGDGQLVASCRGSGEQFYRQRVRIEGPGSPVIGFCSCPVGYNCKHVAAALLHLQQQPPTSLPSKPSARRVTGIQPVPVLSLGSLIYSQYDPRSGRMLRGQQHRAGLAFDYAGARTHGRIGKHSATRRTEDGETTLVVRDQRAEQAFRQTLRQLGFGVALRQSQALPPDSAEMFELASDDAWLKFVQQQLPRLRKQGWQVDVRPGFAFDITPVDDWYAQIDESPRHDWFDLELGIVVDGQRVSLLPVLLRLIRSSPELLDSQQLAQRRDDDTLHLQLDAQRSADGQPLQVLLPYGRLKPLLATLASLYLGEPPSGPSLRLTAPDAARLTTLSTLDLQWHGGQRLRDYASKLQEGAQRLSEPPTGLHAELRRYQQEGLSWMQTLRELDAGGVLGDDMGLGKTLQTLAHLLTEKRAGRLDRPALVVMPTSLIPNWQDEAARFTPELRTLALHGPQRHKDFEHLHEYELLLTTYALLPRDLERWRKQALHVLVLDEAQHIKNPLSKAAQAVRQLDTRQRLCLTGTPLENHLGELWALFDFLLPGWLGDSRQFNRDYRLPIEKLGDRERLDQLNARIKPFLLRRRKEDVATELPPKTEIVHWVELNEVQRDLYETLRLAMDRKVRDEIERNGLARSQLVILDALLKLRQVCCDVRLVKNLDGSRRSANASGKLDSLMAMLAELREEGRRVLLFSQFTSMLALIEEELQRRHWDYVQITGATRDRRTPVQRFQRGEVPLFLISLKAGGTGLNLTAADTVIHYDPWWNPAAERQASDRAYRIGQDKPVFVYKLIARGTVEEKIHQLQQHKAALSAGVLEGGRKADWQILPEDIEALFAASPAPRAAANRPPARG